LPVSPSENSENAARRFRGSLFRFENRWGYRSWARATGGKGYVFPSASGAVIPLRTSGPHDAAAEGESQDFHARHSAGGRRPVGDDGSAYHPVSRRRRRCKGGCCCRGSPCEQRGTRRAGHGEEHPRQSGRDTTSTERHSVVSLADPRRARLHRGTACGDAARKYRSRELGSARHVCRISVGRRLVVNPATTSTGSSVRRSPTGAGVL
jgi:hypothetical protein